MQATQTCNSNCRSIVATLCHDGKTFTWAKNGTLCHPRLYFSAALSLLYLKLHKKNKREKSGKHKVVGIDMQVCEWVPGEHLTTHTLYTNVTAKYKKNTCTYIRDLCIYVCIYIKMASRLSGSGRGWPCLGTCHTRAVKKMRQRGWGNSPGKSFPIAILVVVSDAVVSSPLKSHTYIPTSCKYTFLSIIFILPAHFVT